MATRERETRGQWKRERDGDNGVIEGDGRMKRNEGT